MSDVSTNRPVVILPCREQDQALWLPLWEAYQAFYQVSIPLETTRITWSRILDPGEQVRGALAWQGGQAVGLVHWLFHRSTWTATDTCYLQDLFVDSACRGTGTGRRLIEHVARQAETSGTARVYWLTHETNTQAMALYDKVAKRSGFVQYRKPLRHD